MRRSYFIFIFFIPCLLVGQISFPSYQNYVNDYANIISVQTESEMNRLALEVKQKTGAEIAVLTVSDMQGLSIDDYATRLFQKWGIGESNNDNGLLFLLSMQERKIKIEIGYGLEGIINDGLAGEILDDYVLPFFKNGNYNKGFYNGLLAVSGIIAKDANVKITGSSSVGQPYRSTSGSRGRSRSGNLFFIIVFVILVIVTRGRILTWLFLASLMGGGGRGGGFGSGGGSFSGGFGGFGGGMSGGGGASRGF